MEYRDFIKKLDVPPGHTVPKNLTYEDVAIRAISRADLHDDGVSARILSSVQVVLETMARKCRPQVFV